MTNLIKTLDKIPKLIYKYIVYVLRKNEEDGLCVLFPEKDAA